MPKLSVKRIALWVVLLVGCVLLAICFFKNHILYTSNTLSSTYSRNATSFTTSQRFYVRDNVLYFVEVQGERAVIRYAENNLIHTFTEIPENYKRFIVVDDKTVIVQIKDTIYLLDVSDGGLTELCRGDCVGYKENYLYFTDETALYERKIADSELRKVTSFDEFLASYDDGVVYKLGGGIYQLFYAEPDAPQLITVGEIPWTEDETVWLLGFTYLYTSDYALRIGSHALDMYIYETGEIKRIFETEADNMVIMAVVASKNELYVSRQWADLKFYPLKSEEINGTYRYDIQADTWTKISDDTCSILAQFDKQSLYGYNLYGFFERLKTFKID